MLKFKSALSFVVLFTTILGVCGGAPAAAQGKRRPAQASRPAAGQPYPQFRSSYGTIRWIAEQMPLKVYVARGTTLDGIIDQQLGAPACNVDNLGAWPDVVANALENPEQLASMPVAEGFQPQHFQACVEGINSWKGFEREGLFSYNITEDPSEADIYVFFVHHFVNKLGLGLFANDIRGYTAKRSFPYKAIMSGKQADFKPVVVFLRTCESNGSPMPYAKMRAAAAHEMGHALGIEGHSTNPVDLMSLYYGNGMVSANDAATIRYLYHVTPDLIP